MNQGQKLLKKKPTVWMTPRKPVVLVLARDLETNRSKKQEYGYGERGRENE